MPATEIISRLWLGSFEDMTRWEERRRQRHPPPQQSMICVIENQVLEKFEVSLLPDYVIHCPVLEYKGLEDERAPEKTLDKLADIIENELAVPANQVLVFCGAGQERSPLTVMWFLYRKRGVTLAAAYQLVKKLRPQIMDRRSWIQYPEYRYGIK